MKKTLIYLVFLLFCAPFYGQTLEVKFQKSIDSIYQADPGLIGIMTHVESPDQNISWSGAVGYSDKNIQKRLEPDETALIASCTKTYVSATILRLVEEKKIEINQSIKELLTDKTRKLFESDGYNLDAINIAHLLSHTSGLEDYVSQDYTGFVITNPKHRWTRDEQLEFAVKIGSPLGDPGKVYKYADTNYLLLSEIIEKLTGKSFYTAMRKLLRYESLKFNNTWFPTLEEKPNGTKPMVHQYWGEYCSYDFDISTDLYGGGGIACTTKDLASFSYNLFNAKIIKDTSVLNQIFTKIQTEDSIQSNYCLGLMSDEYGGLKAYGHGGFWGTYVYYFPDLNTSVSVYILEKDKRVLSRDIMDKIIGILLE